MNREQMPRIPVAWGEVFDKLTILDIKLERISDIEKLRNIRKERDEISAVAAVSQEFPGLTEIVSKLHQINSELWGIEDDKRRCERTQNFGEHFVQLARQVYIKNDERARLKREINVLLGSQLIEEKSYVAY